MKKVLIYILMATVLVGIGYFAYRAYKQGRQTRLVDQARRYLEKNNQRKARLALQRALNYNTNDVEACRLMARLDDLNRSSGALFWRSRVVELNPRSLQDRLAFAQTALTFRQYAIATNALAGVDAAGKNTAAYHNAVGTAAAEVNQSAQAEAQFLEAVRIEPQNSAMQLNLAVVRLQRTNVAVRAEARATLARISSTSTNLFQRSQALRELLVDSMRYKQFDNALAFSNRLLQDTNSVFHDRIMRLEVLQQAQNAGFKPALAGFQREAAANTNSSDIYELATWQMANTSPKETLVWLKTVPLSVQTNPPLALVVAEAEGAVQDWTGLATFVAAQDWGEFESLRHAFHTRALRGLNSSGGAKGEWELSLKAANGQKQSLAMLLVLTRQWNWQSESEELLWAIVNNYPGEGWAVQELTRALYATGRTRSMMLLCRQQSQRAPANLELKRELALLALLLEAEDMNPHELAREVYEKNSTQPACAATYAFSLFLQKKKTEALEVMRKLTPQEAESPGVAGYYGLILQANGEGTRSKTYLDLALKRPTLPEERKLFEKARTRS